MEIANTKKDSSLKENITLWVLLDTQLKTINEKTKKMREKKNELSQNICKYIIDNNIKNKIKFEIINKFITNKIV